ncbi:MAG: HNH endonuclease [Candidatus Marinimicrobia bacterium]|nr:HNH endonuclease [Candidatus Neomarinimicrobiota bacterium]
MPEEIFGEVDGFPEGSTFDSRMDIKNAGLHKYHIAGISRVLNVGCDSIVLNGGYVDDRDYGDEILYTGEGGRPEGSPRQTFDQTLTKGNLDLSKNKYNQLPVRVIRGTKHFEKDYAPTAGYRYDGLYYVEDYYPDVGEDGFRIWRYKLVKEINTELPPTRDQDGPAPRTQRTTDQIQRDPHIPQRLKEQYNFTCQVCGIRLEAGGNPYVIGAHIKPLGRPHDGPDLRENMILLCPNDHYLFDAFAFSINDDFTFVGREGSLTVIRNHNIGLEYIRYHRERYEIASRN